MDEITATDRTLVAEVGEGDIEEYEISPKDRPRPPPPTASSAATPT